MRILRLDTKVAEEAPTTARAARAPTDTVPGPAHYPREPRAAPEIHVHTASQQLLAAEPPALPGDGDGGGWGGTSPGFCGVTEATTEAGT